MPRVTIEIAEEIGKVMKGMVFSQNRSAFAITDSASYFLDPRWKSEEPAYKGRDYIVLHFLAHFLGHRQYGDLSGVKFQIFDIDTGEVVGVTDPLPVLLSTAENVSFHHEMEGVALVSRRFGIAFDPDSFEEVFGKKPAQ